jgi:gliding motility-associated lipoprotein GldD
MSKNLGTMRILFRAFLFLEAAGFIFLVNTTSSLLRTSDFIPKPPTYLRINLPDHYYHNEQVACFVMLESADIFTLKNVNTDNKGQCAQEIDLGPINGTLYLFYKAFNSPDSLAQLINISNDFIDDHKIKADRIDFQQIIDPERRVFGTFFTLKGNVATNYQFYLTDSTSNFIRGEVLLNCKPNYDSLRPSLEYLKIDLLHLVNSLQWKKN